MSGCDHKFLGSNNCAKCGVHVDELNRQSLAALGTFTTAARKAGFGAAMQADSGAYQAALDHEALDRLLAQYLIAHPKALPSKTSIIELAEWNAKRFR